MDLFKNALITLVSEEFEGIPEGASGTWFVEGKEGIFDALETHNAAIASRRPSDECASIADHANHILFAMRGLNCELTGSPAPEGTWTSSWAKQEMNPEEWVETVQGVRHEYGVFKGWLSEVKEWKSEDQVTAAMTFLAHMAFHLGAIRQILKVI